jgi:non-ribosomal peptide synthetase component F
MPERPISALALLSPAERSQLLVEWNDTTVGLRDQESGIRRETSDSCCVHQLFAAQAARTPDAIALAFPAHQLTYRELDQRANQLAWLLRARGVGPEVLVGVCMPRALELPLALLAVLKAGGAYLPRDPSYPAERLAFMCEDSRVSILITATNLQDTQTRRHADTAIALRSVSLSPALLVSRTVVDLHTDWPAIAQMPATPSPGSAYPEQLAYVIYTSGSTGAPKAALNSQRAISNRLHWMQETYHLTPADRVLQKTPFSFDVSVWEFFWPFSVGARLVLAQPARHQDAAYLRDLIAAQQITTLHFVPSMLQTFLEQPEVGRCVSLTRVICSGEALPRTLVTRSSRRSRSGHRGSCI